MTTSEIIDFLRNSSEPYSTVSFQCANTLQYLFDDSLLIGADDDYETEVLQLVDIAK
jgi:hypothetical protein